MVLSTTSPAHGSSTPGRRRAALEVTSQRVRNSSASIAGTVPKPRSSAFPASLAASPACAPVASFRVLLISWRLVKKTAGPPRRTMSSVLATYASATSRYSRCRCTVAAGRRLRVTDGRCRASSAPTSNAHMPHRTSTVAVSVSPRAPSTGVGSRPSTLCASGAMPIAR